MTPDPHGLLRSLTHPRAPELTPELTLHLARPPSPLWGSAPQLLERLQLDTPYWAFAWPGGQALARFLLDHPSWARGRRVLDVASGSAIAAIAAARAGATRVDAIDRDPIAASAALANATLNHVDLHAHAGDLLHTPLPDAPELILAGDIFYDAQSPRFERWLRHQAETGARVLIGDPGRAGLPASRLERLARYRSPAANWLQDDALRNTSVYALQP